VLAEEEGMVEVMEAILAAVVVLFVSHHHMRSNALGATRQSI